MDLDFCEVLEVPSSHERVSNLCEQIQLLQAILHKNVLESDEMVTPAWLLHSAVKVH